VTRPVRSLLFSTLYPSEARPTHGIFVETRLRELLKLGAVETRVVAPVPWFPSTSPRWGEYARIARTPARETRHGIDVQHPRYLLLPKVGMQLAPLMMALGARAAVQRVIDEGFDFDLIDAHYYYPDGVAAAILARWFDRPFCVTARGTDLNLIPAYRLPRAMIRWTAQRAQASIGVCAALMDVLRSWDGIDATRLHVLRNGVDLQRFRPLPQAAMRHELGLADRPTLLSVGHLIERKGHHLAVEALALLAARGVDAQLMIVGEGEERPRLEALIRERGVGERVRLVGAVPNTELLRWYSAADVLILASSREGWANVLLEAMACGTPVAATRIWGTPEVVTTDAVGLLVDERSGAGLAQALQSLIEQPRDRATVRRYAEGFSWADTSQRQVDLFRRLATERLRHA
jgi:teichuronic acid biosynthesis glycosyltransferase TuaC